MSGYEFTSRSAADEDDSDRFPQTSQESAQISTHSPDEGSRVVPDPARVARYAELIGRLYLQTSGGGVHSIEDIARAVVAVADEERASLVELVREMGREAVAEAEAYRAVLARAEAAEAKVVKVEALLDPDTTWRCSDCGWVADEQTINQALWHEAERTVSMVCPECSAEGSFVDHEPLVEDVSDLVHAAWMDTKREQGVTSRPSEWGEEQMVPYAELSERAKDLDRGTVRAVLDALRAVLADAPAEHPPLVFVDKERAALVAEVERLREELATARAESIRELQSAVRAAIRAEAAEAKVAKVEALHRPSGDIAGSTAAKLAERFGSACMHCAVPWPCPTIAVLADAPAEQRAEGGA